MPRSHPSITRREASKIGAAALAGAVIDLRRAFSSPRKPGEVRALLLTGDIYHSAEMHEVTLRGVLEPENWTLLTTRHASCVTPEVIGSLDLLILYRSAGWDALGFSPDAVAEHREPPGYFMTDALEQSVVENVRRGMGIIVLHCAVYHPERRSYMDLLGIESVGKPGFDTKVSFENLADHPVMNGVDAISPTYDQVWPVCCSQSVKPLFTISQGPSGVSAPAGWCRQEGNGRVAVLTPGHKVDVYHSDAYKRVLLNASKWAIEG